MLQILGANFAQNIGSMEHFFHANVLLFWGLIPMPLETDVRFPLISEFTFSIQFSSSSRPVLDFALAMASPLRFIDTSTRVSSVSAYLTRSVRRPKKYIIQSLFSSSIAPSRIIILFSTSLCAHFCRTEFGPVLLLNCWASTCSLKRSCHFD